MLMVVMICLVVVVCWLVYDGEGVAFDDYDADTRDV